MTRRQQVALMFIAGVALLAISFIGEAQSEGIPSAIDHVTGEFLVGFLGVAFWAYLRSHHSKRRED